MQTVNPVYSLYVNCREGQHDEYMQFKRDFENFFRRMEAHIKLSEQKGVAPHYIGLSSGRDLTYCIANKQLYLGIYDRSTGEISRKCELSEIKGLGSREYNFIETRINNILRLKDRDILQDARLNAAWGREIPRIIREQQEMNRPSISRSVQPETPRSTQEIPQGAAQFQRQNSRWSLIKASRKTAGLQRKWLNRCGITRSGIVTSQENGSGFSDLRVIRRQNVDFFLSYLYLIFETGWCQNRSVLFFCCTGNHFPFHIGHT